MIELRALWMLAAGLALCVLIYVLTAGHVIFLPLLLIPLGIISFGSRRRRGQ